MAKGNMAREMAAAPIHGTGAATAQPETAIGAAIADAVIAQKLAEQAETIKPVSLPFELVSFKLNGKAKDYPNDDDPAVISRKVALAVVRIKGSSVTFKANIYRTRYTAIKNEQGQVKITTRLTMPTTGKGFPVAVFDVEDPREERALDAFKAETVRAFKTWASEIEGRKDAVTKTTGANHADELVEFE